MHGGQAEMCKADDPARQYCRALSPVELQGLGALTEDGMLDEVPALLAPGFGASEECEFVRIDKNGGRRVYASKLIHLYYFDAWPLTNRTPHQALDSLLRRLKETGTFELRYALKEKISDLEVVSADDSHPVRQVAAEGGEVRVLVKDKEQDRDAIRNGARDDSENWHALDQSKIGGLSDQPKTCETLDDQQDLPQTMRSLHTSTRLWEIRAGSDVVRRVEWGDQEGLWLCRTGHEPRLIARGFYFNPVVTPDGRWLVVVKRSNGEDSLVRIELRTNREARVDIDNFYYPLAIVPGTNKVLFGHDSKNNRSEHRLLDPATGAIEPVDGEFAPIEHQQDRALQPVAGMRDYYWAAIPDFKAKLTRVGRYDAHSFKFTSVRELPSIMFTSNVMWVDESAGKLYIAYNGHLLAVAFPALSQPRTVSN